MVNWNQFQNATDPGSKPTPGWLFNELIKDVRNSPNDVPDVAEYLMQCVCSDQLNIQLKGVLCIKHIASEEIQFQNYMQSCHGALKILDEIAAPPIVPQARAIEPQDVRTVRDATKSALDAIRTPHSVEKTTAGAELKARCQGFGNYEPPPEETPKKQGVAGQAAEFVADSIGDMVDDFREKGAVGALKDATVDALDLVLDGVDTIWGWVAGSKNQEAQRICQPASQMPHMPGQFAGAPGAYQSPVGGFIPPAAAPKTASNAYAAAFGGGVVGANNPVQVGGMAPAAASSGYSAYSAASATSAPAPAVQAEPPKPAPAPMVDLLSMDEPPAAAQPTADLLSMDEPAVASKSQVQTADLI
eukprot:TRINITY_DN102662_c0_g1_i1.p1 TRINITY_DN102662_c0_g1~~TRINITY_DN102662_c0_g1_i1.p1  ORF type:complete len:359 (-),score=84.89 TRINITY_DN102662_c0_g1_i1:6-1082(-)